MSIFINKKTKVIVLGITGKQGSFHTQQMLDYGTNIVAGVTPGKGGQKVSGVPVFNSVKLALRKHKADWAVLFVPAPFAKGAAIDCLQNGLHIVIITEGLPQHDAVAIMEIAKKYRRRVLGPNCPGLCSVGESKIGIMPNQIFKKGNVGIVSRSGTLTYEIVHQLSSSGMGQSSTVGIGGDAVIGVHFIDALKLFARDKNTKKIVVIGEIGGDMEERTAKLIKKITKKKVVAYIAGRTAPRGKRMGHAGAIVSGSSGTAASKIAAFEKAGIPVAKVPSDIVKLLR